MHSETIIKLEQDMVSVIAAMEKRGLNIDLIELENLIRINTNRKEKLSRCLCKDLGLNVPVNFNSSKDVSEILQSRLGIRIKKTPTGRFSVKRSFLRGVNNPIADSIIQYRELEQTLSALKAIYKATDKNKEKIYCVYVDKCPSGRLYTKDYSFQSFSKAARDIVCANSGCSFLLVDYESFELRILSALAGDTYFKDCWAKGLDLHKKVVSDMQGITYGRVTDKQRKLGKCLNFGLAYGQEASGLARNLHTTVEQAQTLLDDYKKNIPEIEEFKRQEIKSARIRGYSETFYGRKRFLKDILSPVESDRKKAERRVVNHKIQGSGADIVKFSLVALHNEGFIINTMLHDGILLTVPDDKLDEIINRVREIMEQEINGMKFSVSIKIGKTWEECNKTTNVCVSQPKLSVLTWVKRNLTDKVI